MTWLRTSSRPFYLWATRVRPAQEKDDAEESESGSYLLDENLYHRYQRPHRNWRSVILCVILLASCAVSLLVFGLKLSSQPNELPHNTPNGSEHGDCGSSIEEARQQGCIFDVMSFAWQRPACYYPELIESFKARTDWHFYSNLTMDPADELPLDRVLAGDYKVVYAEKKYHPIHCTYMWRKLHMTFQERLPVDNEAPLMSHTLHCERTLLIDYTGEASCKGNLGCPTRLSAAFTKCGYA